MINESFIFSTIFLGSLRPIIAFPSWSANYLPLCPEGLKPYSDHGLNASSIELSVAGLGNWPEKGNITYYCYL